MIFVGTCIYSHVTGEINFIHSFIQKQIDKTTAIAALTNWQEFIISLP